MKSSINAIIEENGVPLGICVQVRQPLEAVTPGIGAVFQVGGVEGGATVEAALQAALPGVIIALEDVVAGVGCALHALLPAAQVGVI